MRVLPSRAPAKHFDDGAVVERPQTGGLRSFQQLPVQLAQGQTRPDLRGGFEHEPHILQVLREPRPVYIYKLEILGFQPGEYPTAEFEVECSKGTYVRTLASDIGDALGVGAHLKQLTRTAVGNFRLEDSCTLEEVADAENLQRRLISIADALSHLPQWSPTPAASYWVNTGYTR